MLTTVQKVGPVLGLFTTDRPEWGVSEVSHELGVAKSSAHAIVTSMVDIGLLRRTGAGRYRLGWRLVALGRAAVVGTEERNIIGAALRREASRVGDTMHFAVCDDRAVVYLDKVEGRHSVRVPTQIGVRLPAHISAVGKVLLAFHPDAPNALPEVDSLKPYTSNTITTLERLEDELATVRDRGYALDSEESMKSIFCAAAPIHSVDGKALGAVGITATRPRFAGREELYIRNVRRMGEELTRQVKGRVPSEMMALAGA